MTWLLDFQPLWFLAVFAVVVLLLWRATDDEPVDDRAGDARRAREAVVIAQQRRAAAEHRLAERSLYPERDVRGVVRDWKESV